MKKTGLFLLILLSILSCDVYAPYTPIDPVEQDLLLVHSSWENIAYLINYDNFEIIRTINLNVRESLHFFDVCPSTNNDYLIFAGVLASAPSLPAYFLNYNIERDSIESYYPLGIRETAVPRICAAYNSTEQDLIYYYTHKNGTYAVNFHTQKSRRVSSEKDFPRKFYVPQNKNWIVLNDYTVRSDYSNDYSELKFYSPNSILSEHEFTLNLNDEDGINFKDMTYSEADNKLYISYLISQQGAIRESAFFGSYNLITQELDTSKVKLDWSSTPYQIAYNSDREECYMIGESNILYVIGLDSARYYLKNTVVISDKSIGESNVFVTPDNNYGLISSFWDNKIFVVDLNEMEVIKSVSVLMPSKMIAI